jgi:hypothetical protein
VTRLPPPARSVKIEAMTRITLLTLALALAACQGEKDEAHDHHAAMEGTPLPMPGLGPGARVFFVSPADGSVVRGPLVDGKVEVRFEMGAKGVAVEPAGVVKEGSGHHHILVDVEDVEEGVAVPTDERHIHFGKAQTEATLPLTPGEHKLSLQFADGAHRSYGPRMTSTITITVEAEQAPDEGAGVDEEVEPGEAEAERP